MPLSDTVNNQCRSRRRCPGSQSMTMCGGHTVAAELHRVADQVLPQHRQQRRIAHDRAAAASAGRSITAPDSSIAVDRLPSAVSSVASRSTSVCGGVEPPDPGERQQVVDQDLHALGAVDGETDVLGAALVELVAVALLQQLAERRDLAQRLLQIVRRDVGELLEFGVGAPQFHRPARRARSAAVPRAPRVRRRSAAACSRRRPAMARMSLGPRGEDPLAEVALGDPPARRGQRGQRPGDRACAAASPAARSRSRRTPPTIASQDARCARIRICSSSATPSSRAVVRCSFWVSKSSRRRSNSVLPRSVDARVDRRRGRRGCTLAMSGSA